MPTTEHTQREQLSTLYQDHHEWLHRWLSKKLGCLHNAADIAHDTYLRVLVSGQLPKPELSRNYLAQIANGKVIDHWRRKDIEQAYLDAIVHLPEAQVPSPETCAIVIDTLMEIDTILKNLPAKPRQALLLCKLDGLSYREIAQQLNVSISSVEKYIARALLACFRVQLNER